MWQSVASGDLLVAPKTVDEALEAGLSIKDKQWPWRGLHKTEGHHPLLQGKTYKEFWKERGLSAKQVDDWIEDLDTDIHRAITESGWWDKRLFDEIARQEKLKNGLLNKDETIKIAQDLLDEIAGWGK